MIIIFNLDISENNNNTNNKSTYVHNFGLYLLFFLFLNLALNICSANSSNVSIFYCHSTVTPFTNILRFKLVLEHNLCRLKVCKSMNSKCVCLS